MLCLFNNPFITTSSWNIRNPSERDDRSGSRDITQYSNTVYHPDRFRAVGPASKLSEWKNAVSVSLSWPASRLCIASRLPDLSTVGLGVVHRHAVLSFGLYVVYTLVKCSGT